MNSFRSFILRLRDLGIADQGMDTVRRIRTINTIVLLACPFTLSYCVFYALVDARHFSVEIAFLLAMSALYAAVLAASGQGYIEFAMWMVIATGLVHLGVINWLLGPSAGAMSYLIAIPFIATLIIRGGDRITIWPVALAVSIVFFLITFGDREGSISALPKRLREIFYFVNIVGAVLLACIISIMFRWLIVRAEAELIAERSRSERLLRAILPASIAERLKSAHPGTIARWYPDATILMADIVGFTRRTAGTDANDIVDQLNSVFSQIDNLAAKHGIEKIKTMGDGYFAVGGLPEPDENHAEHAAELALEIQQKAMLWAKSVWPGLRFRIILHIGPVVAGVIGRAKFAYDVWGDAVNTAARLQKVCEPGSILITEPVVAALPDRFLVESRGLIEVRDKGRLKVFELVGRAD